jgi:hypothetical protein
MRPIIQSASRFKYTYTGGAENDFNVSASLSPKGDQIIYQVTVLDPAILKTLRKISLLEGAEEEMIPADDNPAFFSFSDAVQVYEPGSHQVVVRLSDDIGVTEIAQIEFTIQEEDFDPVTRVVQLGRAGLEPTDDEQFWSSISAYQLSGNKYVDFINTVLGLQQIPGAAFPGTNPRSRRLPFIASDEYSLIKFGTEFFLLNESLLPSDELDNYLKGKRTLPYYEHVFESYQRILSYYSGGLQHQNLGRFRMETPFLIELIWSYWLEQGMLVQTMNLISLRYQNLHTGQNPLSRFNTDPLRPLSHILWGYIQDEQHRLSIPRRAQEYDHEYGLILRGKAIPPYTAADSRSKFLEAMNNLLTTAAIFYKEADDTTRIADAFPVLNCLREVHLLLAEGNHNAYGNLTWTARQEMLMQQYILARPEMREFLGGRPMVPYPERWMDRVDSVRSMMGWGSSSITYFYDLAVHGERILLSIRYGNWSDANIGTSSAANWALAFRDSIQKYIHAYRTVTGVDVSADSMETKENRGLQPSFLISKRISTESAKIRRA